MFVNLSAYGNTVVNTSSVLQIGLLGGATQFILVTFTVPTNPTKFYASFFQELLCFRNGAIHLAVLRCIGQDLLVRVDLSTGIYPQGTAYDSFCAQICSKPSKVHDLAMRRLHDEHFQF